MSGFSSTPSRSYLMHSQTMPRNRDRSDPDRYQEYILYFGHHRDIHHIYRKLRRHGFSQSNARQMIYLLLHIGRMSGGWPS